MDETKKCPYCAEEILIEAKKCKHCGEWLTNEFPVHLTDNTPKRKAEASTSEISTPDKRTLEFILALLGGLIGIGTAFFQMLFGAFADPEIANLGIAALLFSIIGIIGGSWSLSNGKKGGIILVTATIGGLVSSSMFFIIPGILLLIPGIMGLKKPIQKGKTYHLVAWLVASTIVLLGVFWFAFLEGSNSQTTPEATEAITDNQIYYMGETVTVEPYTFVLNEASKTKTIDSYFETLKAKGTYVIIDITIKNTGKESVTLDTSLFELIDGENRIYEPDFDATFEFDENDLIFSTLGAGLSTKAILVFDVTTTDTAFALGVKNGMFSDSQAWIRLRNRENSTQNQSPKEEASETPKQPQKETIKLPTQQPKETTEKYLPLGVKKLIDGEFFAGSAIDNNSGDGWDFGINLLSYDEITGKIVGRIEWPELNAIHEITGYLYEKSDGNYSFSFEETAFIVEGEAVLGCKYDLIYDMSGYNPETYFEGTWKFDRFNQYGPVYFFQP